MAILQKLKEHFSRDSVTLDLQDIQALILRSRPEPYVGVHAMLHFDEAAGARNLLGRLAPHIASADNWSEDLDFWIGAALSFEGLKALGVPDAQLKTFPLPFQQGMAARAEQLRDFGPNAPENWEDVFKPGNCHLALTIYAVAIMTRSVTDGLASVESSVRNAAIAVGFGPWRRFWTVDFPLAGPVMLAGLRVTAVSTISLATVGALIGVQNLGYLFTNGSQRRILPEVFAGVLAVVIIALVIDALLLLAGRALMPWTRRTSPPRSRARMREVAV